MKLIKLTAVATVFAISFAATAALPMLQEEAFAREQEALIITSPIAGIENSLWFDYRIDVTEAQKELTSDLRRKRYGRSAGCVGRIWQGTGT